MVEIREMQKADVEGVAALEQMCFSVPWSADSFRAEMENEVAVYFVAEEDGRIIGYCGFWQVAGEGHITNVAVLPDFRKQGVGSRLVSEMVRCAKKAGLGLLTLEVRKSNQAAIALYEKFGFSTLGERKNYYRAPMENALIMTVFLESSGL